MIKAAKTYKIYFLFTLILTLVTCTFSHPVSIEEQDLKSLSSALKIIDDQVTSLDFVPKLWSTLEHSVSGASDLSDASATSDVSSTAEKKKELFQQLYLYQRKYNQEYSLVYYEQPNDSIAKKQGIQKTKLTQIQSEIIGIKHKLRRLTAPKSKSGNHLKSLPHYHKKQTHSIEHEIIHFVNAINHLDALKRTLSLNVLEIHQISHEIQHSSCPFEASRSELESTQRTAIEDTVIIFSKTISASNNAENMQLRRSPFNCTDILGSLNTISTLLSDANELILHSYSRSVKLDSLKIIREELVHMSHTMNLLMDAVRSPVSSSL